MCEYIGKLHPFRTKWHFVFRKAVRFKFQLELRLQVWSSVTHNWLGNAKVPSFYVTRGALSNALIFNFLSSCTILFSQDFIPYKNASICLYMLSGLSTIKFGGC